MQKGYHGKPEQEPTQHRFMGWLPEHMVMLYFCSGYSAIIVLGRFRCSQCAVAPYIA